MALGTEDPATRRLRELAAQEVAATKERLALRTPAARSFSGAVARLVEAKAVWESAQAEAERSKAKAVGELLGSGMQAVEVAELLGISEKELRALRPTASEKSTKASGATNGAAAPGEQSTLHAS
jgi:hypothetical protein